MMAYVQVFKCKTMNMFQISKKLSGHMKKYSDLVGDEGDEEGDRHPSKAKGTKVGRQGEWVG